VPTLVLQMGHAGRTKGATGAPGEQAYTQEVGAAVARLLDGRGGWLVRLIVADPPVAQYRGDAFIAVHADGSANPAVRGASVGYQNDQGRVLASSWAGAYVHRGFTGPWHPDNYTVNLAQYYGVSTARAQGNHRACIIECGTITNADDRSVMAPDRVAWAIGDALGILRPPEPEPIRGSSDDMIITCATPNRAGILSGGMLLDITDDPGARGSAQSAIDKSVVAEIRVTEQTWDRLAAASRIAGSGAQA